jgi:zinc protease
VRFLVPWALALLVSSTAWGEGYKLPVPKIETLPNGLTLVWFLSDSLPIVDMTLLVKTGYRDDPKGKSGTSELLAASFDRGAAGMSAQAIHHAVEMLGATRYVNADEESFTLGMHGLAPDAATLLDLLGKMAIKPDLLETEVKREQSRILDRWSHIPDYGETLVALTYSRVLAANTPYGRGSLLSAAEFSQVTPADVRAFHARNFTPGNSILMIVGRVNPTEFKPLIEKAFGSWTGAAPVRKPTRYKDSRLAGVSPGEVVLVERPGLTQAQVRIGFRAPLIQAPEHYALVVANALLGEYFNSRLNSLIRDKLALTYSIGSSFSYAREMATFTVASATRNESVGQLINKTIDVVKDLKKGTVPQEEVKMAKEYLRGGFPLGTSTLGAVAARWLGGYLFDLGTEYLNEYVPRVSAIDSADVIKAIAKDFPIERAYIVVAGDPVEVKKSLEAAKITRVRRLQPKDLM